MPIYTTEITSETIPSDNPIHQRHTMAYHAATPYVKGDLLEIGCGQGRGAPILLPYAKKYVALDKHQSAVDSLKKKYPEIDFRQAIIPPLSGIDNDSFDTVVSFQVIEHIRDDKAFLKEIHRVMKPGAKALITTPNIKKSLTRNPWHIREYTARELEELTREVFSKVTPLGITGNEKALAYYEMNKKSVQKITRFDIFNLQYRLPDFILRIPYDILNRLNRNSLKNSDDELVRSITHEDWLLSEDPDSCIDLFYILEK